MAYPILARLEIIVNAALFGLAYLFHRIASPRRVSQAIFISRLDSIGDFVLFTATLPYYRQVFPKAKIVLMVGHSVAELARGCSYVDEVWSLNVREFRRNPMERMRWFKKVATAGFSVAIHAVYSTNFDFLKCLIGWTGARRRIAMECLDAGAVIRRTGFYFSELVPASETFKFEISRNMDLVRYLGLVGEVEPRPRLWVGNNSIHDLGQLWDSAFPLAVVIPGAADPFRRWGAANFAQAIKRINSRHRFRWILLGSKEEVSVCDTVAAALKGSAVVYNNLGGVTSLLQAVSVLRRASICVGNETGTVHIAAALNVRTVCIIGGGHFGRFMAPDAQPGLRLVYHPLSCFNCSWRCTQTRVLCITEIQVDSVVDAVNSVLEEIDAVV